MRIDGEVVGGVELLGALAKRLAAVADLARLLVLGDLGGAHVLVELGLLRQTLPFRPAGLELARALDGGPLVLGHDREEVALAYHLGGTDALDRAFIDALELGPHGRRTHHAPVQHARHAEVLHVGEGAGHFVRDVEARHGRADDLVLLGILAGGRLGVVEFERERLVADDDLKLFRR